MSTSYDSGTPSGDRGVFGEIMALQLAGQRAALAAPVRLAGSLPCAGQSRVLVREDSTIKGTIGGGLLEAAVRRQAAKVIQAGEPCLLEFELTQDEAAEAGMICGGACTVLIEPIQPGRDEDVNSAAAAAEADGTGITMITVLPESGAYCRLALLPDGELVGSTGHPEMDAALRQEAERHGLGEEPRLLTEPLRACIQRVSRRPDLYIFGAGHVAVPVAHIAALAGFRITVVDDRAEFADPQRFPRADGVMSLSVDEAFSGLPIDSAAFVIAITRGHFLDEDVVAHALQTPARYIGMIGSRRKVATVFDRLRERGFDEADIARIHAPIGIDIGAETVDEIAISIVAEIVSVRRGLDIRRSA
ncbi:MAG TPA: XdhC family protein [Armatimonadota bacterium]|jgi:xanthine dehydrogenase accessory factor